MARGIDAWHRAGVTVHGSLRSLRAAPVSGVALAAALALSLPAPLIAQASGDSTRRIASDGVLFRRRDAAMLGAFALGATVAYHNDRGVARAAQRREVQDNRTLRNTAEVFRYTGQPGVLVGGLSAFAIGRVAHRPVLATAGLRVTEAIVVTGALTTLGKYVAGRARPFVSEGRDPSDFQWWHGHREGYTAMPSGHTSAAFAAASALSAEWRATVLMIGVTAVSEEVAYRGVGHALLWWMFGNGYLAAGLAAAGFAGAHAVQGRKSMAMIFVTALVMHALVAVTGTLFLAIVVHAAFDLYAGWRIAVEARTLLPQES